MSIECSEKKNLNCGDNASDFDSVEINFRNINLQE